MQKDWKTDWTQFVRSVAADFERGMSANQVTDKYRDQMVEWLGKVISLRFDDDPAIKLQMPPVSLNLSDGRHGVVDYLSLVVNTSDIESWKRVKPGDTVRFQTSIRKGAGPFPGLEWADLGDKKGYISIGTNKSLLVDVVDK